MCCGQSLHPDYYESAECDADCKKRLDRGISKAGVLKTTGALVAAATAFAFLSFVCAIVGLVKIDASLGAVMFKVAGVAAFLGFVLGLVAVILFSGGCGCPDGYAPFTEDKVTHAAQVSCGIYKGEYGSASMYEDGATPENRWCLNKPYGRVEYTKNSPADKCANCVGQSDDWKQIESQGTGTAYILCIVGFVMELLNVVVCFVLVKPGGGGAVKPAPTGVAP